MWTKPLVHGLPWTCQAVISQWFQQGKLSNNGLGRSCFSLDLFIFLKLRFFFWKCICFFWSFIHFCSLFFFICCFSVFWCSCSKVGWSGTKLGISNVAVWYFQVFLKQAGSFLSWCCTLLIRTECTSADSRDSTGRLDKDNVPHTKSEHTDTCLFFHGNFLVHGVHGPHWDP